MIYLQFMQMQFYGRSFRNGIILFMYIIMIVCEKYLQS